MATTRGGKNLAILGVGAVLLACLTTSISLMIYHNSGDIYLDRSRPGYLPDKDEVSEESDTNTSYNFSENGELTEEDLVEYLKEFKKIEGRLESFDDPYSPVPLSNSSLGIPSELEED